MNKVQLFTLLNLVLVASASNLWLNNQATKFAERNRDWYQLEVPCEGGSGLYGYDYQDIPAGWDNDDGYLLIPRDYDRGRYQVKLIAYDIEYRVSIERYVVIELRGGKDYEVFIRESYDTSYNLEYYYNIQDRDIYDYPSWGKIQGLIEDGDITQLRGIILRTIDSDNDCDDKRSFLTAILNRIDKFLRDNDQDIREAQNSIRALEKELVQLERHLRELQDEKKGDSTEDIRAELRKAQNNIAWLEKRIKNNNKKIQEYRDDIEQYNKRIWEIKDKKIPDLQRAIKALEKDLKDVVWKIKEGKGDIMWLRKQKLNIENRIERK